MMLIFHRAALAVLLLFFAFLATVPAQQPFSQTIKGVVIDKSVKTPLAGATIALLSDDYSRALKGATADAEGHFRIPEVPVGKQTLKINYLGYKELVLPNIQVISGKEVFLTLEMEEDLVQFKAVEIRARADKDKPLNELATVSTRTFSVEETQRFAAAVNDPARMAASFAGVVIPADGNNIINIRGNSSNGLLWRMEGVEIPNPNHFSAVGSSGGGISILSAQLLGNSDFMTGAFAAEYGNALSGVFDLRLRKGNADKREYTFQAGVLGIDLATEGPMRLGKRNGSYLVNYRYSTLSLLGKMGIGLESGSTDFQDLSFNLWMPAGKAGTFTLFGMGGLSAQTHRAKRDSLEWESDEFNRYESRFKANTGVAGLTHSLILGNNTYLKTVVAASGTQNLEEVDKLLTDYSPQRQDEENHLNQKITVSSVLSHKFTARHFLRAGAYLNALTFDMKQLRRETQDAPLEEQVRQKGHTQTLQTFAQWQYKATEKWTFNAGAHSLYLFLNNTWSVEPRASLRYALNQRQSLSFGYGLHAQMQPLGSYFVRDPESGEWANPDMDLSKSQHYVLSYDHSLGGNLRLKTEAYYQHLYHIPVRSDVSNSYSMINLIDDFPPYALKNTGKGRNYGLELTFEKFLTRGLYFILASSWYNSEYQGSDGIWRNSRYNGRYASTLTGGKEWGWNRRGKNRSFGLNVKMIYTGGLRGTPLDLDASRAEGSTVYDETRAFELQMPAYYRLDVGVRIKRNYAHLTSTLSLDLQNATNRRNVFGQYFDTKTLETKYYYQTPLIPVLAYKLEF
jgi:hypothetical protein